MGYGANMTVTNRSTSIVTTGVSSQTCMYDNGDDGSNVSFFNNIAILPNSSAPSGGSQYIEAKSSGSCAFEASSFTLILNVMNGRRKQAIFFIKIGVKILLP